MKLDNGVKLATFSLQVRRRRRDLAVPRDLIGVAAPGLC